MCRKDDLERISVEDLSQGVDSYVRAVLVDWMMEVFHIFVSITIVLGL